MNSSYIYDPYKRDVGLHLARTYNANRSPTRSQRESEALAIANRVDAYVKKHGVPVGDTLLTRITKLLRRPKNKNTVYTC